MRKLLFIVLAAAPAYLFAQEIKQDTVLNEVIISGNRMAKEVFTTSRSARVITSSEIEKSAYNTVGELLSNETSIYVVGSGQNPGSNQSLFMRGSNSNHVNVLIDGVKITDPSSPNGAIDFSEISVANIERIEIIKGSHGALYGTGGIGGVINIITKKAQEGLAGNASLQVGSLGGGGVATNQNLYVNYGKKGFYVNGSVFNSNINGINAAQDTSTADTFKKPDEDDFRKTDYSIKAGYKNNVVDISIGYKKADQRADIDDGAFADDDNYKLDFDRDLYQYGINYQLNEKLSASFNGGYSESTRLSLDDSSLVAPNVYDQTFVSSETDGLLNTNEVQLTYQGIGSFSAILGAGMYKEEMDLLTYFYSNGPFGVFEQTTDYDSVDMSLESKYAFASINYHIGESVEFLNNLYITSSVRYTDLSNGSDNWSFDFSPSYQLNNSLIYLSYSQGFNQPSLTQLYSPNGVFNFTTRGNENLNPETSRTYEVGVKHKLTTKGFLTASAFRTTVKNAIEYVYLWNANTPISNLSFGDYLGDTYINIAEQNILGLELEAEYNIANTLKLRAGGTWLETEMVSSDEDLDVGYTGNNHVQLYSNGVFLSSEDQDSELVRRPTRQIFGAVEYNPKNKFSTQLTANFINSRPDVVYDPSLGPFGALGTSEVDDYLLFDLSGTYQLKENMTLTGRIENLLDEDYFEINGFNSRGRSFYIKLSYNF
ncbi:TonB-dependent receptor plug domain-containing protein [Fulvivirga lutea]|uniref:TonB-dependent receptor n=1 Tax=Fulvivirga lutea TaxID=2810512 RepID=A0A974WGT8_9BACT|nr:TonB-dependent receptor [Fulvivirga lutea]QSE97609.1 TonB-dependent receptor [Fulvivirga lutea]